MERRIQTIKITCMFLLVLLLGRLWYVQVICGTSLKNSAESQQLIPVIAQYNRGIIYDRNKEKLTDCQEQYHYFVRKELCDDALSKRMHWFGGRVTGKKGEDYLVYSVNGFYPHLHQLMTDQYGAYGIASVTRYDDEQTAAHLIGYAGADGTGCIGLERAYDQYLRSTAPAMYLYGDGTGAILDGTGLQIPSTQTKPPALVTTLDKALQHYIEQQLSAKGLSGAVVVMDVKSGQLLASASSPSFNPNQLEQHVLSTGNELVNKVLQGEYPLGLLYGLLTEAAALEEKQGIYIGTKKENLLAVAGTFGLGAPVLQDLPEEAAGKLLPTQKHLLATPIQVCYMTNLLANKGCKVQPAVVLGRKRAGDDGAQVLSAETAKALEARLPGDESFVVETAGAGGRAEGSAGVDGPAGWWYTGYFPVAEPQYTVTVYIEKDKAGSDLALPVFRDINRYLAEKAGL